eukprot:SAG11_NODE_949_length_6408_cov_16.986210_2_plen_98_part_00
MIDAIAEQSQEHGQNEQVVVVTINYRLNVFGFLGSSELANSSADGSTGNFGLQDQRLAMEWVCVPNIERLSLSFLDPNASWCALKLDCSSLKSDVVR